MLDAIERGLLERIEQDVFSRFKSSEILFHARIRVDSHVSKKNSRPIFKRGRKSFLGKSSKLVSAENALVYELRTQRNNLRINKPFRCDLHAMFLFKIKDYYVKDKVKKTLRRRLTLPDLSNLLELPADCLQTAGIIENDTQICSFDLSRRLPSETNELEIFLIKFDEKNTIL